MLRHSIAALAAALLAAAAFRSEAQVAEKKALAVTYLPKERVAAAFAKGVPLHETADYKIHASRREGAGMAEVHLRDTDIIYVLSGSATFVTGGGVVDAKTTAQDEMRGKEIAGGETREIVPGDIVVVPAGVPHWFKRVSAPMTYFVVKATR